jgi:hypothetical protein
MEKRRFKSSTIARQTINANSRHKNALSRRNYKWCLTILVKLYKGAAKVLAKGAKVDIVKNAEKVFSRPELSRKHVFEMSRLLSPSSL